MDREKFDQILKDKVQKFEQGYSPVFNEQRVWSDIKKDDSRKRWVLIAAASVIVIISLSILLQQYNRSVEIAKLQRPPVKAEKPSPISVAKPSRLEMVINKGEEQVAGSPILRDTNPDVTNESSRPIAAIAVSDNMLQRADSNQVQIVKMLELVKVKTIQLPTVTKKEQAELKVTFRRGGSVADVQPAESKLAFKKFKLRIFENQTYDTSAYASGAEVEADRKFRIKF